jgi:PIN domain nuclease of toxin-antitoxin system
VAKARKKKRATSTRVSEASVPTSRRLLLDTHVWLWWQADDSRLGRATRKAIASAPEVRLSVVSAWEIAIKISLGKLTLPRGFDVAEEIERDGFAPLAIEMEHAAGVLRLPALHRDPFDRMLISQAIAEGLTLVTADPQLDGYGTTLMEARR